MTFKIGDQVSLKAPLRYLKTADSMPVLRPSDLVSTDETGEICGIVSMGIVEVLFRRGKFLISENDLMLN